jgi:hypothetical protein
VKGLFIKWALTFLAIGIALVCVFFPEIRAVTGNWISGNDGGMPTLSDADLGSLRAVKFLPVGESIVKVDVSSLHVIEHGPGYATVGITLTSSEPTSRYPSLKIYLQSGRQTVRTVVISPAAYQHQATLSSEQVTLTLTLHPGETGFTAGAFYGDGGA